MGHGACPMPYAPLPIPYMMLKVSKVKKVSCHNFAIVLQEVSKVMMKR